jgi:hypothetical protein
VNNKSFIITDENEDLEQKIIKFLIDKFGESRLKKINIEIGECFNEERITFEIEIEFLDYPYINRIHGKSYQSFFFEFEPKLLPFFDSEKNKYFTKEVFEWQAGGSFQNGVNEVYGLNAEELFKEFEDYLLTC